MKPDWPRCRGLGLVHQVIFPGGGDRLLQQVIHRRKRQP